MGSESLFTKCKTCGKEISKSAKSCPQCGEKQKKMTFVHWIGVVFLGLILVGIMNTPEDESSSGEMEASSDAASSERSLESRMPEGQRTFVQVVSDHAAEFGESRNELQESRVRDRRKEAISATLDSRSISFWVGTINQLETNMDGKAILSVRIAPNIDIKTWNNAFSDLSSNTLIEKDSPIYNSLLDLSNGQRVVFSGSFFPSESDFIEETSITIQGSLKNPEFLFQFSSVRPIN